MNKDTPIKEIEEIIKYQFTLPLIAHPVSLLISNLKIDSPSLIKHEVNLNNMVITFYSNNNQLRGRR